MPLSGVLSVCGYVIDVAARSLSHVYQNAVEPKLSPSSTPDVFVKWRNKSRCMVMLQLLTNPPGI